METKTKTIIILLIPLALVIAGLWFNAVFGAGRWLFLHGQEIGTDMWIRTVFTLISAFAFAFLGYKMIVLIRLRSEIKKKRRRR